MINLLSLPQVNFRTIQTHKPLSFRGLNPYQPYEDRFERKGICESHCNDETQLENPNLCLPEYLKYDKDHKAFLKATYMILYLESYKKGYGTKAIKEVVKDSLNNPKTRGRVCLYAEDISEKGSPAGFYYKLGFRFADQEDNQKFEEWLKNGGQKKKAPQITGSMYLPKKNILHCLSY